MKRTFLNKYHICHHAEMTEFFTKIKLQFNYQIFSVSVRCLEYSHDEQTLENWSRIFDSWSLNLAKTEIFVSILPMEKDYTGKFQSAWVILFSESLATLAEQRGYRSWSHVYFRSSNIRGNSQSHTWKFSEQLSGAQPEHQEKAAHLDKYQIKKKEANYLASELNTGPWNSPKRVLVFFLSCWLFLFPTIAFQLV